MYATRWNRRRLAIVAIFILILYYVFSASNNSYEASVTIRNVKPETAWEYVADFNKIKFLNPTMWVCRSLTESLSWSSENRILFFRLDFKILSESGHLNDWKYTVEYTEHLSHWPHWINVAEADFFVRKLKPTELGDYLVASNHRTCFLGGLYCRKLAK